MPVPIEPTRVARQNRPFRQGHLRLVIRTLTEVPDLDFVADLSVDAAVIMWALPDTERPKKVLRTASCTLRPGGEILIVESPEDSLARGLWYENYNRSEELASMLELAGFQEVKIEMIEQGRIIWAVGFRPEWL